MNPTKEKNRKEKRRRRSYQRVRSNQVLETALMREANIDLGTYLDDPLYEQQSLARCVIEQRRRIRYLVFVAVRRPRATINSHTHAWPIIHPRFIHIYLHTMCTRQILTNTEPTMDWTDRMIVD
jgi:hypothetical protein